MIEKMNSIHQTQLEETRDAEVTYSGSFHNAMETDIIIANHAELL